MAAAAATCGKDLSAKMAEGYNPTEVEAGWYQWWESSGFFKPKSDSEPSTTAEPFVVVLPPPNVTGYLHLGHALTGAVQDTVIRYHRMRGYNTLYVPGTDHAGIATQVVVEKRLAKATGQSRHDLGREAFIDKVWEFKHEHCGAIQRQLRLIGSSLDWSREAFTLDAKCNVAVTEAFVKMYEDGIILRDTRLVNWCCALQSAISDLEVEAEEVLPEAVTTVPGFKGKVEIGRLTNVAYKVVGMDAELVVATTRPETILGDTAIAIHPEDPRYKQFHGMRVQCPFRDESIPIICDPILVDKDFGTGVVKVTPAHDPNDFECGNRHKLPRLTIMDLQGRISLAGDFFGQHRFEARKNITAALEKKGLLRGVTPHAMRIARCTRTNDIIEPLLMPQWFVDCTQMAADSVKAVEENRLRIIPEEHKVTWYHWLRNIKPWCVSRQLWWGHRIPAYLVKSNGIPIAGEANRDGSWVVARNAAEATAKAQAKFPGVDPATITLDQDPDVLDTWFSSGLWPFSTLGWPENNHPDMQRFFPGSLLETGHDILFFWVARMVMMSLHLTGKLPFTEVYLHAMVRDKDGRKMSKSLGNVIDPVDVIRGTTLEALNDGIRAGNLDAKELDRAIKYQKETYPKGIPECGSDALRFGLLAYTQSGKNVNMDVDRITGYRQFCNKLWNVVRYILYHALDESFDATQRLESIPRDQLPLECLWILSRLDVTLAECNEGLSRGTYDFAKATNAAYRFWLYELCDVYLEFSKVAIQRPKGDALRNMVQVVLLHVVDVALRMLHPMMPIVTEELWHRLPNFASFNCPSIMLSSYPLPTTWRSEAVEAQMTSVLEVIHNLRSVKGQYQLAPKQRPDCWVVGRNPTIRALIASQAHLIKFLAAVGEVAVIENDADAPDGCGFNNVNTEMGTFVLLRGMIDVTKEIAKIDKQIGILAKQLEGIEAKQKAAGYETKVPADVRKQNEDKAASIKIELAQLAEAKTRMAKFN